jgi:type IV secretion system protein VirB10
MVGIAAVILLIILITGRPQPAPSAPASARTPSAVPAPPERIRGFERQLSDDEARLRDMMARSSTEPVPGPVASVDTSASVRNTPQRVGEPSLAADNIAFSRRSSQMGARANQQSIDAAPEADPTLPGTDLSAVDTWMRALAALMPTSATTGVTPPLSPASSSPPTPPQSLPADPQPAEPRSPAVPGTRLRLLEGTVIEAVLLNRLDGTYAGPVAALVTSPVYSLDRQHVIIPAGAKVLGTAAAVQAWGDARLAVSFHRLSMPDGRTYSLDLFKGLSQVGETGLRDRVNRHYWQAFGASLAIGALSGLAQLHTRSGLTVTFSDAAGQGAGSSLATSATRILDRYLNVLPTVTIREGYRLKVYLTGDLDLPAYADTFGGVR